MRHRPTGRAGFLRHVSASDGASPPLWPLRSPSLPPLQQSPPVPGLSPAGRRCCHRHHRAAAAFKLNSSLAPFLEQPYHTFLASSWCESPNSSQSSVILSHPVHPSSDSVPPFRRVSPPDLLCGLRVACERHRWRLRRRSSRCARLRCRCCYQARLTSVCRLRAAAAAAATIAPLPPSSSKTMWLFWSNSYPHF